MKARLTEQYDVTLTKPEMDELMLVLRTFVREFDASELAEELLAELEEVHTGPKFGVGIGPAIEHDLPELEDEDEDDDGGSPVPA